MIRFNFLFILFFSTSVCQVDNLDWPNLKRYANDNKRVKKIKKNGKRVIFMGNSITEGWDWHYPEYFKEKGYINRGISGQTTPQMLIRFRPDVIDLDPDVVVILAGINDIAENTGPASVKTITDNIISMSELALSNNIKVVISSILPASDFPWRPKILPPYKILKVNSILQNYAIKNNLIYLDYFSEMFDGKDGLIANYGLDTVHPNKAGYIVMSQLLEEAIEESLSDEKVNEIDQYRSATWKTSNREKLLYRYRKPANHDSKKKYPLLVFLHGSGGRGSDNQQQLLDANSIGALNKQQVFSKYESFVFIPQVASEERWVSVPWDTKEYELAPISSSMRMTFQALDRFIKKNRSIDRNRIYVMGLSMGGWGTWDAISRRPEFFAAAVPICGSGDPIQSSKLTNLPIWAWHGERDEVISVTGSQEMVRAIDEAGGKIRYTEIKGRGHDSWLDVWNSQELWKWLYEQRR